MALLIREWLMIKMLWFLRNAQGGWEGGMFETHNEKWASSN